MVAANEHACPRGTSRSHVAIDIKGMQGLRVDRMRQPEEPLIRRSNACVVHRIYELQSYKSAMCMRKSHVHPGRQT